MVMYKIASGNSRGTRVPASAALDFYESRAALYFDLSRNIPEVASWIAALAESLGQRQSAVRVSVFVSPGGGATECHFDSNENFTIQLRGHKRWKMAPNSTVLNPMDRFTITGDLQASMALYWKNEMPGNLELNEVADLVPGSMLYVPRGYWHTVEALEPSLSLNFCIRPESWVSFFFRFWNAGSSQKKSGARVPWAFAEPEKKGQAPALFWPACWTRWRKSAPI